MIHESAYIEKAEIGEGTNIWHFVHIRDDAKIGRNCNIGKGVYVDTKVIIGDNCLIEDSIIGPHVSIDNNCKLESVKIKNSVVMQDSSLISIKRQVEDSLIGKNTEVWEEKVDAVSLFIGDNCKVRVT